MENLTGRQLGPYLVVAPLEEGGMAAVYKAYQPSVDRHVALKVLPRYLTEDPQYLRRFRREARIVARLQHPHVLTVHDFGESDGYTFFVMPLVHGGTLADLLTGLPLSLPVAVRVVTQVCAALDYAHAKGVVHRDVKPSNILIDEGGNCLLADFGIAHVVEAATKVTSPTLTGQMMGTPAYMSPEQVSGEGVGPPSDLYSVGIVLYQMLTGRVPFRAETPVALMLKHLTDPLPSPRTFNPALTPDVEAVVLKALARSRDDRFVSGAALVTALTGAVRSIQQAETVVQSIQHREIALYNMLWPAPADATERGPRDFTGYERPPDRLVSVVSFRASALRIEALTELHESVAAVQAEAGEPPVPFEQFAELVKAWTSELLLRGNREVAFGVAVKDAKLSFVAHHSTDVTAIDRWILSQRPDAILMPLDPRLRLVEAWPVDLIPQLAPGDTVALARSTSFGRADTNNVTIPGTAWPRIWFRIDCQRDGSITLDKSGLGPIWLNGVRYDGGAPANLWHRDSIELRDEARDPRKCATFRIEAPERHLEARDSAP